MLEELDEVSKLIGRTPIISLRRMPPPDSASVFLKLEYANPGGSHKDRIGYYMIREAIEGGLIGKGGYLIEISSGNTATAVAWISARLGLKPILILEEEVSRYREASLRLLGAEVMRVEGDEARFSKAKELEEKLNGVFLNQFENEANFRAHYETTSREIIESMERNVDAFVMGIGTGGTLTGVGKRLKEELGSSVRVIGVVPRGSALIHGRPIYEDRIGGLSKVIFPELYRRYGRYVDEVVEVSEKEAIETAWRIASCEGLLVGPSTGAAVSAALKVAEELGRGRRVVTIAADSLFRYPELFKF